MWLGLNAVMEHAYVMPGDSSVCSVEQIFFEMEQGRARQTEFRAVEVIEKSPWGRSFEDIRERLETDGPAYVEGDGSFVLCGKAACSSDNRTTLWFGQLPSIINVLPTNQWRAPAAENAQPVTVWRIEGGLSDGANGLDSISLNGWAPWAEWQRVFELLGPIASLQTPFPASSVLQFHQFGLYLPIANIGHREM